jgi:hypothetical protein
MAARKNVKPAWECAVDHRHSLGRPGIGMAAGTIAVPSKLLWRCFRRISQSPLRSAK